MAGYLPPQGPIPDLRSMTELLQAPTDGVRDAIVIDTFYNSLNQSEHDSLNYATNGNFLTKNTQEALTIIEINLKFKLLETNLKLQVLVGARLKMPMLPLSLSKLKLFSLLLTDRLILYKTVVRLVAVYMLIMSVKPPVATIKRTFMLLRTQIGKLTKALQERPQGVLLSNTVPNPREDLKAITTRSGVTLAGPSVPPLPFSFSKEPSLASTSSELPPAPVSSPVIPERNPHQPLIPYTSSFAEALAHMPKFAKMVKDLLTNKEKLLELANTPLNENCSVVILKRLLEKLGDTKRFLIPCDFYGLESCMALADLGASINLMPLSVWKTLSLPELTPTRMTLELATQTVAYPAGIAKDVFVQVGKFTFPTDFVVFDYDVDPRVPLILGRPFLRTACALVNGHFHEVLDVQKSINPMSGSPTPSSDHVVASLSPSLTPFGDSNFILEEIDTFLTFNDSMSLDIDDGSFDMNGDIRLIKTLLNNDISNDLPPPLPVFEINETEKIKTSIDDPPDLELKDLPPYLEYAFLERTS
ncbi:reverse transcriptase domain-containing protein [Tanacetum coccineum]|uniref:Reverse transcriptase domain-containing protein n=1 Tax=Tanacetum coccineum TaxID=301880 RepID=A0ABQ5H0B0_9ASTR